MTDCLSHFYSLVRIEVERKIKMRIYLQLLCFCLLAVKAWAETPLTLPNAIEEALTNNASLHAAEAEAKVAQALVDQSDALGDPMLTFKASNYPADTSPRKYGMTGNEIMLSQKFPAPGKRTLLREQASHNALATVKSIEDEKRILVKTVRDTYFDLFLSTEKQSLILKQQKILEGAKKAVLNKIALGQAKQSDVYDLETKLLNAGIKAEELKAEIIESKAELNHLMGRGNHSLAWNIAPIVPTKMQDSTLKQITDIPQLVSEHPSLQAQSHEAQAAATAASLEKLNQRPDLEFGVGYMQRFANNDDTGADFFSAQLTISLPFLEGGKYKAKRSEAEANREKQEALYRENSVMLQHALTGHAELLRALQKKLALASQQVTLAESIATATIRAYESQEASYDTLLSTSSQEVDAKERYYTALVEHEKVIAELQRLIGEDFIIYKGSND